MINNLKLSLAQDKKLTKVARALSSPERLDILNLNTASLSVKELSDKRKVNFLQLPFTLMFLLTVNLSKLKKFTQKTENQRFVVVTVMK